MRIKCMSQKNGITTFLYIDPNFTRLIPFTDEELATLKAARTLEEMTRLPEDVDVGIYEPQVALSIYSLLMLKPGNQELVDSTLYTSVDTSYRPETDNDGIPL